MIHLLLAVIYISFISLGLPDSLLGSAWPLMYPQMGVDVSFAGIISVIISGGTVLSSLLSDRLTRKFGVGVVTAVSVSMTALALLGFSASTRFWMLCLFAIPYGLGAGSVDAALNNYVALHYASKHMSWLHCMWGLGASIGPYILGFCLSAGKGWPAGYRTIGILQAVLASALIFYIPMWQKMKSPEALNNTAPLSLLQIFQIPGAKAVILAFFCYCGVEATSFLWASSYMVLHRGISEETAVLYAGLFYLGITGGRALSGFLTMRYSDSTLIRLGAAIIIVGVFVLMIPAGPLAILLGFALMGLGCAPIYPCIIHSTPAIFGAERSQALIGVQMAGAYVGSTIIPPIFGLIANHVNIGLFPVYILVLSGTMILSYQILLRRTR